MKTIQFKAASTKEARKHLSELFAAEYNDGDRAEVTLPDGSKYGYVFISHWADGEAGSYIIKPDGPGSGKFGRIEPESHQYNDNPLDLLNFDKITEGEKDKNR